MPLSPAPQGEAVSAALPAARNTFTSVNGSRRPVEPGIRGARNGSMVTTPAHSVMPRILRTGFPVPRSKASASSPGSGDPPVSITRSEEMSASTATALSALITVGTPPIAVTRCSATCFQIDATKLRLRIPSRVGMTRVPPADNTESP